MSETHTDCRSHDGVTVGLVDSLISISRVLRDRDLSPPEVQEAFKDLADDEDFLEIFRYARAAGKKPLALF